MLVKQAGCQAEQEEAYAGYAGSGTAWQATEILLAQYQGSWQPPASAGYLQWAMHNASASKPLGSKSLVRKQAAGRLYGLLCWLSFCNCMSACAPG